MVDRINQETAGIAINLGSVLGPFRDREKLAAIPESALFDRHAGVSETSRALYLMPDLVDLGTFSQAFYGEYSFRSDFFWDGLLNLSDVGRYATSFADQCP